MNTENKRIGIVSLLFAWIAAILVTTLLFYGLDHFIMGIQGLPLNIDLSPAQ